MKNKKYKFIVAILLWGGMMLFVSAVAADEKPLGWFGIASPTDRTVYIGKDGYKISATLKGVTEKTQNIESSLEEEQLTFDLDGNFTLYNSLRGVINKGGYSIHENKIVFKDNKFFHFGVVFPSSVESMFEKDISKINAESLKNSQPISSPIGLNLIVKFKGVSGKEVVKEYAGNVTNVTPSVEVLRRLSSSAKSGLRNSTTPGRSTFHRPAYQEYTAAERARTDLEAAKIAKAKWEEERRAEAQKARMDEMALQRSRGSNSIVEPEPINRDSDHSMYGVASTNMIYVGNNPQRVNKPFKFVAKWSVQHDTGKSTSKNSVANNYLGVKLLWIDDSFEIEGLIQKSFNVETGKLYSIISPPTEQFSDPPPAGHPSWAGLFYNKFGPQYWGLVVDLLPPSQQNQSGLGTTGVNNSPESPTSAPAGQQPNLLGEMVGNMGSLLGGDNVPNVSSDRARPEGPGTLKPQSEKKKGREKVGGGSYGRSR